MLNQGSDLPRNPLGSGCNKALLAALSVLSPRAKQSGLPARGITASYPERKS
jgi:hypothetical protein